MTETEAVRLAELLREINPAYNVYAFNSGGNVWLTILKKKDNTVVVFGPEGVGRYVSEEAIFDGSPELQYIDFTDG